MNEAAHDNPYISGLRDVALCGNRHTLWRDDWYLSRPDRLPLFCDRHGRKLQEHNRQAQSPMGGGPGDSVNSQWPFDSTGAAHDNPGNRE